LQRPEPPGYILRQRSSADERQVRVSLTGAGRKLLDKNIAGSLIEACGLGDEFPAVQKTVARLRDNLLRNIRTEAKTS
jgi:DNA-binding MarR family transcriptional regulator